MALIASHRGHMGHGRIVRRNHRLADRTDRHMPCIEIGMGDFQGDVEVLGETVSYDQYPLLWFPRVKVFLGSFVECILLRCPGGQGIYRAHHFPGTL